MVSCLCYDCLCFKFTSLLCVLSVDSLHYISVTKHGMLLHITLYNSQKPAADTITAVKE